MTELKLSITHYKILHTIYALNKMYLFPNQNGVYKILDGEIDEETKELQNIPTFGCLISYSSKKICHYVLALIRHKYVAKIFDRNTNDLYLTLTKLGEDELLKYLKKHPNGYKKVTKSLKISIVKID